MADIDRKKYDPLKVSDIENGSGSYIPDAHLWCPSSRDPDNRTTILDRDSDEAKNVKRGYKFIVHASHVRCD